MSKPFTKEETQAWLGALPKKGIGVKVIITSERGSVLILKARGKGWQLPGGSADQNEDPQATAVREVKEELGLDISKRPLKPEGVAYRPDYDHIVIFYSSGIELNEAAPLKTQVEEVEDYKFVEPSELPLLLNRHYQQVLNAYKDSLSN